MDEGDGGLAYSTNGRGREREKINEEGDDEDEDEILRWVELVYLFFNYILFLRVI